MTYWLTFSLGSLANFFDSGAEFFGLLDLRLGSLDLNLGSLDCESRILS